MELDAEKKTNTTAHQTRTPLAIQGRVSAAAEISISMAQLISIATGAALSTVVDYRILLVGMAAVVAASAIYLVTRREEVASVEGEAGPEEEALTPLEAPATMEA